VDTRGLLGNGGRRSMGPRTNDRTDRHEDEPDRPRWRARPVDDHVRLTHAAACPDDKDATAASLPTRLAASSAPDVIETSDTSGRVVFDAAFACRASAGISAALLECGAA